MCSNMLMILLMKVYICSGFVGFKTQLIKIIFVKEYVWFVESNAMVVYIIWKVKGNMVIYIYPRAHKFSLSISLHLTLIVGPTNFTLSSLPLLSISYPFYF